MTSGPSSLGTLDELRQILLTREYVAPTLGLVLSECLHEFKTQVAGEVVERLGPTLRTTIQGVLREELREPSSEMVGSLVTALQSSLAERRRLRMPAPPHRLSSALRRLSSNVESIQKDVSRASPVQKTESTSAAPADRAKSWPAGSHGPAAEVARDSLARKTGGLAGWRGLLALGLAALVTIALGLWCWHRADALTTLLFGRGVHAGLAISAEGGTPQPLVTPERYQATLRLPTGTEVSTGITTSAPPTSLVRATEPILSPMSASKAAVTLEDVRAFSTAPPSARSTVLEKPSSSIKLAAEATPLAPASGAFHAQPPTGVRMVSESAPRLTSLTVHDLAPEDATPPASAASSAIDEAALSSDVSITTNSMAVFGESPRTSARALYAITKPVTIGIPASGEGKAPSFDDHAEVVPFGSQEGEASSSEYATEAGLFGSEGGGTEALSSDYDAEVAVLGNEQGQAPSSEYAAAVALSGSEEGQVVSSDYDAEVSHPEGEEGDAPSSEDAVSAYKVLYLTFDDGPNPTWTPEILDLLEQYDARGTFFVIGEEASKHLDLVQRIVECGDIVGHHTWSHRTIEGLDQTEFSEEIQKTTDALGDLVSPCLRPPQGAIDAEGRSYAKAMGLPIILWNIDPRDWDSRTSEEISSAVIDEARSGRVVLLHDGGGDRSETVAALQIILETLSKEGYRFEPVCPG